MLRRLNTTPPDDVEARLRYLDGDYQILKAGSYVRCAVTGEPIALDDLRYWSVELQEPYKTPEISLQRYLEIRGKG